MFPLLRFRQEPGTGSLLAQLPEHSMSGWTLGPGLPPAVHRSRGDGRGLTRGAEAAPEALITGLRREPLRERDLHSQAL